MPPVHSVMIWDGTTPAFAEGHNVTYASRLVGYEDGERNTYGYSRLRVSANDLFVSGMQRKVASSPSASSEGRRRGEAKTFLFESRHAGIHLLWNEDRLRVYIPLRGEETYVVTDAEDLKRFRSRVGRKRREASRLLYHFVNDVVSPDWTEFEQTLTVEGGKVYLRLDTDLVDVKATRLARHLQEMGAEVASRARSVPSPRRLFH